MPNFTYNRDIPDAPNNPSVDQPPMKVNTNSTDDLINIDHFSFNDNNGGLHKQVTMINQTAPGFPNGGNGLLFAGVNSANSWPHWQNALGTVVMVNGIPSAASAGYTYLPGGIILQWGVKNLPASGDNAIAFPITFPTNCFNVQLSVERAAANIDAVVIKTASISTSGFTAIAPTAGSTNIYWVAIGN